jgi:multiple antibiotic resistance protein
MLGLAGVILVIVGACFVSFLLADRIERLLGDTAAMVITRLLGVLLAALSVQFIVDGIRAIIAMGSA